MKRSYLALISLALLLSACGENNNQSSSVSSSEIEEIPSSLLTPSSSEEGKPSSSSSESIQQDIELTYEIGISGDEAVLKKAKGNGNVAHIPSTYNGKTITRILDNAFDGKTKLTKVVIPEGVVEIGKDAFNGCTNLEDITLPSSIRKIGVRAFANIPYISKIIIPEGVEEIGDTAFSGDKNLAEISLPNSLKWIGSNVFSSEKLKTKVFNMIQYLGNETNPYLLAYKLDSRNLAPTSASFNKNTRFIGGSLFEGEKNLAKVTLNEGLYAIGNSAFRSCPIEDITIPSTVEVIGAYSFSSCAQLKACVINGNSLKNIMHEAFSGAGVLESISIPSSVEEIGFYAFNEFGSSSELKYNEKDGGLYLGNETNPYHALIGLKDYSITSFNIADTCVVLAAQCLRDAKGISSLSIPTTVKSIGESAFFQMTSLTEATIPSTVEMMGGNLFNSCGKITKIILNNAPTVLETGFAQSCPNLTSFVIPSSVRKLETGLFDRDESLTELVIPSSILEIKKGAVATCKNLVLNIEADDDLYLYETDWFSGVKSYNYGYSK